jgi:hypothetical protein
MTNKKISSSELENFIGTERYFKEGLSSLKLTEGMQYLRENANCYWLTTIVASVQHTKKVMFHQDFIIWRLVRLSETTASVQGFYDCEENGLYSESKLVYSQDIGYTDFPFEDLGIKFGDAFEFYQCGEVLLLKSEY